jgi:hypothetical protein
MPAMFSLRTAGRRVKNRSFPSGFLRDQYGSTSDGGIVIPSALRLEKQLCRKCLFSGYRNINSLKILPASY